LCQCHNSAKPESEAESLEGFVPKNDFKHSFTQHSEVARSGHVTVFGPRRTPRRSTVCFPLGLITANNHSAVLPGRGSNHVKVFAVVLIALCTWYAKHVMITVDSVIQQFNRFVH
jgi:hypothetical protein